MYNSNLKMIAKENKSELFSQRLFSAVIWNIGLQIFLSLMLVFIIEINLLHPMDWVASAIQSAWGFKMTFNIVPLVLVTLFQAFIYGRYYMVPPPRYFTRFSMFINLFTMQNLIFGLLYALSGYFTIGLYSSLAGGKFSSLIKLCEHSEGKCLVEEGLILQLGGFFMGIYYFLKLHIFGTTMLIFPHIYQEKFIQIKSSIIDVILTGFSTSIAPVIYYWLFYYIWGHKPRNLLIEVYSVYLEDPPLDNVLNFINSGLILSLWVYSSLFFVTMYTMRTVFNIVLMEPMKFPINSSQGPNLHEALGHRMQLSGFLAAQDLKILAIRDEVRRAEIFTLSHPGGHPRNWHSILGQCLVTINDFSKELETINNIKTIQNEIENSAPNRPMNYYQMSKLRNMGQAPQLKHLKDLNKNKLETVIVEKAKAEFQYFLDKLCQKPGINYFFGELTDSKLKYLMARAQPVTWTCEGLAFLCAASLTEDKYGVVQNDLPTVISALIQLKQNIEKLSKLGLITRRHYDVYTIKLKASLLSGVKRSIYKIVLTFSKYMNDIPLDSDTQLAIQPFLLFKEI